MSQYKQKEKPQLKYATIELIIDTAKKMKLPIYSKNWDYSRWWDWGLVCEAAAERIHKRKEQKAERDRIIRAYKAASKG